MVDKIGSLSAIVRRLQQARAEGNSPAAARPAAQRSAAASAARPTVEQRVLQRLASIDPEDPRRRQRAIRAFIEVRLLDEFGDGLSNDAGFQQLVDDVVAAMHDDPSLQADLVDAADRLLAKAAR